MTHKVIFEQPTDEVFTVTLPLAVFSPTDDDLYIERDKLIDHMMTSLRADVVTAEARAELASKELEQARARSATMAAQAATMQAKVAGLERMIEGMSESQSTSGEAAELRAAMEVMGSQLFDAEQALKEQAAELERLRDADERASESAGRAADVNARLNHSNERIEQLKAELAGSALSLNEANSRLAKATTKITDLETRLRHAESSLALADKAKANALAAQEASYLERLRTSTQLPAGSVVIPADELEQLRELAGEATRLAKDLGKAQADLHVAVSSATELTDMVEKQGRELEDATYTIKQAEHMMAEQHGLLQARRKEIDFQSYLVNMLQSQPEINLDTGRLSIMNLYPENIVSAEGEHIHPDKPICWWTRYSGIGCVVMLSANPADDGKHYLVMPKVTSELPSGETVDISSMIQPPKEDWDKIVDLMMGMDRHAMLKVLQDGEVAAHAYASMRNPEVEADWAKALQHKSARESLARRHAETLKRRKMADKRRAGKQRKAA